MYSPARMSSREPSHISYVPPPGVNPVPTQPYGAMQEMGEGASPALVKGFCRFCKTLVSNTQLRTKLADGTYVHQRGPDGLCIGIYSGLPVGTKSRQMMIDQYKAFAC